MEIFLVLRNGVVVRPWFRDRHHHCQRQIHAVHHHKFQCIVQHGGIGSASFHHRKNLGKLPFKIPGRHVLLSCQHPVDISLDRIDLSIMYDQTVRMRPFPAGFRVGTEPGMDHGDGRLIVFALQILIKSPQLSY